MRVAVVGGGAVVSCCAYELAEHGAEVVVVEAGRFGAAASFGNAGWITPALSAPLAAPGALGRAARHLLDRHGAFRIRPRADVAFLRWCLAFARASLPARYRTGTEAVLRLNARTFELFERLRSSGADFELSDGGVLFAAVDEGELAEYEQMFATLEELGYEGELERLDGTAAHEREPALGAHVVGALHAKRERYLRPEELTAALAGGCSRRA